MNDFQRQLHDQLGFIDTSAGLVLRGNHREAVRIATAIRVIVHQTTPKKPSLLTLLGTPNPEMLSTGTPLSAKAIFGESGLTRMAWDQSGMRLEPTLDRGAKRLIPFTEWWEERIFTIGGVSLTRRELVLAAANKDGGAHVDPKVPENYEMLRRELWTASVDGAPHELEPQAMITLVQVGFEVNHSPGIRALVGVAPPAFLQ